MRTQSKPQQVARAFLVALTCLALNVPPSAASSVQRRSLADLAKDAELIFEGKAIGSTGTGCSIALANPLAATFSYQTTGAGNQPTGSPNVPATIAVSGSQSFIISVTPAPFNAMDVPFNMQCANAPAASSTTGLNTLLLSTSNTPEPDIVALAATSESYGYVHLAFSDHSGAFAVAIVNLGATAAITASADTGTASLPLSVMLCQTDPTSGQCITPIGSTVPTTIAADTPPTFAIFIQASTPTFVPDPANKRVFVRFRDSSGVTRGSTSVAVTNLP